MFPYMSSGPNWIMNPFRAEILYLIHILSQGSAWRRHSNKTTNVHFINEKWDPSTMLAVHNQITKYLFLGKKNFFSQYLCLDHL